FAQGMRELMLVVKVPKDAIDIVGTGGDGSNSFNISTVSALVVASCGVKVAKHGNRAASSKCGSADVLEALGVDILLTPQKAQTVLQKAGFVFLFAPQFHPAMKIVGPVRRELKIRTIFNYLGPFLNPAKVQRMLLGVANLELAKKFLSIARKLNFEHLLIVTSVDGMDEISVASETHAFELKESRVKEFIIDPKKLGFKKYFKSALAGGEPKLNAQIVRDILSGKDGAKKDATILNSAYALLVAGRVKDVREGIKLAIQAIESGKSFKLLEQFIKETNK
ncbi:anthranilate phosphoribosyltransferase, partial [Candidatus Daviesbacteria bacterium]|nr:anthranilate phosphoribosyltransferase [Candidatus Daviesbacteria bacterium]